MSFTPTAEPESPSRIEKAEVWSDESANPSAGLETDPRWLSVQRLVHSESFAKASRLSSFLLYIVERSLRGRPEEITEQQIGVHVFGRPTNYNPGDDNIVRQTARQLRQRLALYYQEEGRNEIVQIVVPRGGYTPQFQGVAEESAPPKSRVIEAQVEPKIRPEAAGAMDAAPPAGIQTQPQRAWLMPSVLVFVGVIIGVALTLVSIVGRDRIRYPHNESEKLWNTLFTTNQRTIIVPGDAGINMYGNLAGTQVDIWEYGSGSYLTKPAAQTPPGFNWAPFAARRYTTISDLKFVSTLLQIPNVDRSRMEVRFARDITAEDLKQSNAILIGSSNYDPWIQIFDKNQNFNMVYNGAENSISVHNRNPLKGEQATYKWSETDPQRTGYAIISLTDNLGSTGKVLLVEGTTMGGIDAATDFLFHSPQMDTVVRDAMGKNQKPSNFELLLMTTIYMGGSMKAKVIGERIHSPA
ncbi:hypothetical protein [Silvibacterium acidisoli]|uniref:hypothetical protein n=1 Tax=Acidobacteriaceae bacterium ZG23-2 TaxID=2883246 RepID=UPI00406D1939